MGYYGEIANRGNPGSSARRKARKRQLEQERAERERAEHNKAEREEAEREARAAEVVEQHEPEAQGEPEGVVEHEPFWKRLEPGWWEPHFASGEESVRVLAERGYWTKEETHGYTVALNRYHTRQRQEQ
ncbi:MAG: hypothetical protein M3Q49_10035 [Actinomycetota bacterium]|nr:hypothetical protein [Actinomycetota bacterium]